MMESISQQVPIGSSVQGETRAQLDGLVGLDCSGGHDGRMAFELSVSAVVESVEKSCLVILVDVRLPMITIT
jgi:hypothetical protein